MFHFSSFFFLFFFKICPRRVRALDGGKNKTVLNVHLHNWTSTHQMTDFGFLRWMETNRLKENHTSNTNYTGGKRTEGFAKLHHLLVSRQIRQQHVRAQNEAPSITAAILPVEAAFDDTSCTISARRVIFNLVSRYSGGECEGGVGVGGGGRGGGRGWIVFCTRKEFQRRLIFCLRWKRKNSSDVKERQFKLPGLKKKNDAMVIKETEDCKIISDYCFFCG